MSCRCILCFLIFLSRVFLPQRDVKCLRCVRRSSHRRTSLVNSEYKIIMKYNLIRTNGNNKLLHPMTPKTSKGTSARGVYVLEAGCVWEISSQNAFSMWNSKLCTLKMKFSFWKSLLHTENSFLEVCENALPPELAYLVAMATMHFFVASLAQLIDLKLVFG